MIEQMLENSKEAMVVEFFRDSEIAWRVRWRYVNNTIVFEHTSTSPDDAVRELRRRRISLARDKVAKAQAELDDLVSE